MPYLLLLILLAILGGPWLVAAALALTGIWFVIVWTVAGITFAALLIGVAFFVLVSFGVNWFREKPKRGFTAALDQKFKNENECERGIYKEDCFYIVELNGQPMYFRKLNEARNARDIGIGDEVKFSIVPKDHPSRRPFNQY
ncbi:MAG: hypothetical protein ACLQOQ_15205 [Beijerinckiaceae bacterium]